MIWFTRFLSSWTILLSRILDHSSELVNFAWYFLGGLLELEKNFLELDKTCACRQAIGSGLEGQKTCWKPTCKDKDIQK